MNVLIIGGGGREHALAWKLAASPEAEAVYVAPGNAGTACEGGGASAGEHGVADIQNVPIDDVSRLIDFARQRDVGLTVVGPEAPLADGIVDRFVDAGLRIFGPSQAAAALEASKVFCKELLRSADVPTAEYRTFDNPDDAVRYLNDREESPLVVKADGLAAGKGVIVCERRAEAVRAVESIARDKAFGTAGDRLVIEERLVGQEASVLAITDGKTLLTLPPCQDHKPAYDGDTGPNTGGMGAYCPAPLVDDAMLAWVEESVLVPTVHAMKRARRPIRGVLYAGLMITKQGPRVLEYNVRFGDPECQPLLMRMRGDLLPVLDAAASGRLDQIDQPTWDPRPAVCVVMASEGYPGRYAKGHAIRGLDEADAMEDVKVFHAGTKLDDAGQVVTAGGRVLGVTALGTSIAVAKRRAYEAVKPIRWPGAWCRKDIADKAIG